MAQFTNINHLIAHLQDIRDQHGIDLPVKFCNRFSGDESLNVDLKVLLTYDYNCDENGNPVEPTNQSELVFSLY